MRPCELQALIYLLQIKKKNHFSPFTFNWSFLSKYIDFNPNNSLL